MMIPPNTPQALNNEPLSSEDSFKRLFTQIPPSLMASATLAAQTSNLSEGSGLSVVGRDKTKQITLNKSSA